METVATVVVSAVLFLVITALWSPPSWLGRFAVGGPRREPARDGRQAWAAGGGPDEAGETTVEWGLFTWPFVRRRLDALAEELERLDRDPDIFAKAFHTRVARSAYEALLADASRLTHQPRPYVGQTLEFELVGTSTGTREELEL